MFIFDQFKKIYRAVKEPEMTVRNELSAPALKLLSVLQYAVDLPQYQKGYTKWKDGTPKTFCNILARDVLEGENPTAFDTYMGTLIDDYRYDVSSVFERTVDILNITIPEAHRRARLAAALGKIKRLTPQIAQRRANAGVVIWIVSGKYNHEAIVCPDLDKFMPERGPKIGQAGGANGIMYISDVRAWGRNHRDPEIEYYEFPDLKKA